MKSSSVGLLLIMLLGSFSPREEIGRWRFQQENSASDAVEFTLVFQVDLKKHWLVYSSDLADTLGPIPTHVQIQGAEPIGTLLSVKPLKKWDNTWNAEVSYFSDKAVFRQQVKKPISFKPVQGTIIGQYCNSKSGQCIPFREAFEFN